MDVEYIFVLGFHFILKGTLVWLFYLDVITGASSY